METFCGPEDTKMFGETGVTVIFLSFSLDNIEELSNRAVMSKTNTIYFSNLCTGGRESRKPAVKRIVMHSYVGHIEMVMHDCCFSYDQMERGLNTVAK